MSRKIKVIVLFLADTVITSIMTVWMWNTIVSGILGAPHISIMQGWAISLAIIYFFKQRNKEIVTDWVKFLIDDILYTLMLWAITVTVCAFAF